MNKLLQYIAQVLAYAFFMFFIAYLSSSPNWVHTRAEDATLKVSVRHAGKIVGECRDLSAAELQRLPPNMKVLQVCPRERSPVTLRIEMDDELVFESKARPSGLKKDGLSTFYGRFDIPAGKHRLKATMNDDVNNPGQTYSLEKSLDIKPRQVLVVDFKEQFIFK